LQVLLKETNPITDAEEDGSGHFFGWGINSSGA
jgi:hypothetical protein